MKIKNKNKEFIIFFLKKTIRVTFLILTYPHLMWVSLHTKSWNYIN